MARTDKARLRPHAAWRRQPQRSSIVAFCSGGERASLDPMRQACQPCDVGMQAVVAVVATSDALDGRAGTRTRASRATCAGMAQDSRAACPLIPWPPARPGCGNTSCTTTPPVAAAAFRTARAAPLKICLACIATAASRMPSAQHVRPHCGSCAPDCVRGRMTAHRAAVGRAVQGQAVQGPAAGLVRKRASAAVHAKGAARSQPRRDGAASKRPAPMDMDKGAPDAATRGRRIEPSVESCGAGGRCGVSAARRHRRGISPVRDAPQRRVDVEWQARDAPRRRGAGRTRESARRRRAAAAMPGCGRFGARRSACGTTLAFFKGRAGRR